MLTYGGADVNARNDKRQTALHGAATNGLKDNIRLLLNAGANIEATTEEGLTALRLAFENGHDDVVRLLLQRGANIRNAYIGRFAPSPKNPEVSMEGFEAGRLAILWWEEGNTMKAQAAMAIEITNQVRIDSTYGLRRKVRRRKKKDSTVERVLDFIC